MLLKSNAPFSLISVCLLHNLHITVWQQPPSQRQHQNQQPAKGYMTVVNSQSPQQQPQPKQQLAASNAASPGQSGFTQDYDVEVMLLYFDNVRNVQHPKGWCLHKQFD